MPNKIATVDDLIKYLDHLEPTNKISDRINAMAFKYKKYLEGYDLNIYPVDIGGIISEDRIAFYFLQYQCLDQQDHSLLHLETMASCGYFFDHILKSWSDLLAVEGIDARLRGLLNTGVDPDSVLWELIVAIAYLRMQYRVNFIPETREHTTADLTVSSPTLSRALDLDAQFDVECKFYKRKNYDSQEHQRCLEVLDVLIKFLEENKLNLSIEIKFKKELLEIITNSSFKSEILKLIETNSLVAPFNLDHPDFYISIKKSEIQKVNAICKSESTFPGAMMARLLSSSDSINQEEYFIVAEGKLQTGFKNKYFEELEYGSVIQWSNPASEGKRVKHLKSQLVDIDRQLKKSSDSIVHIGIPVERDTSTTSEKYRLNQEVIMKFDFESQIQGFVLSYLSPKLGEMNAYHIDETANYFSRGGSLYDVLQKTDMIPIKVIDVDETEDTLKSWEMEIPLKY